MESQPIALADRANNREEYAHEHEPNNPQNVSSLPPADGGKDAWLFLASCFVIEALVWGFPFSFGVFQDYYSIHQPIASYPSNIAVIGTTATGIMYMLPLALFPAFRTWPRLASFSKWAGVPLMAIALLAASFAQQTNHLILTQGALYALGGSAIYCPALLYVDEWFIRRKGFAFGVMWAGTGVAGLSIPFLMTFLLTNYGFRTTLRIWSITLLLFSFPLLPYLRPRLPVSSSSAPRSTLTFLLTSPFWLLQLSFLIESLGFFIPSIYLPTIARSLSLSPSTGTLLVALLNAAGVVSTVLMGMLIDRLHVSTVALLSSAGAALSIFFVWGWARAAPALCVFSLLYGFFAGGFVSTNAGAVKLVRARDGNADVGMLIGLLSAARGVGALVSGPVSEALVNGGFGGKGRVGAGESDGYGAGYGGLVVFTGVTAAVGAISFIGRGMGLM